MQNLNTNLNNNKDSWLLSMKQNFLNKKTKNLKLPTFNADSHSTVCSSDAIDFIKIQLGYVIMDSLSPYYFANSDFGTFATKDMAFASLNKYAVSAADVLFNFFLEPSTIYHQITIENYTFITAQKTNQSGEIEIGTLKIKASKSLMVNGFNPSPTFIGQLADVYSMINGLKQTIKNTLNFSNKTIIKVDGLHNAFNQLNSESEISAEELLQIFINQAKNITDKNNNVAMIDASLSLDTMKIDISYLGDVMEFLFANLAMLLAIPQCKLAGRSPSGLNSSGTVEMDHYNTKLESLRKILEDFCHFFDLGYTKKESLKSTDINYLQSAMTVLNDASTLNCISSKELENLKDKTIGYYLSN